ncbi:unnamed protein product [Polarella glacialis]|uniref:SAM domain-containing protein n=1 Tax=Polarella glacialis TaxID=89957 RepID=A0A813I1K4_POLGL|nr:unnamed protein product [Polarella glacialis]
MSGLPCVQPTSLLHFLSLTGTSPTVPCLTYAASGPVSILCSRAHELLNEVLALGNWPVWPELHLDESQNNCEISVALERDLLIAEKHLFFTVATAGSFRAVGLGTNKKGQKQSAKLALAVAAAAVIVHAPQEEVEVGSWLDSAAACEAFRQLVASCQAASASASAANTAEAGLRPPQARARHSRSRGRSQDRVFAGTFQSANRRDGRPGALLLLSDAIMSAIDSVPPRSARQRGAAGAATSAPAIRGQHVRDAATQSPSAMLRQPPQQPKSLSAPCAVVRPGPIPVRPRPKPVHGPELASAENKQLPVPARDTREECSRGRHLKRSRDPTDRHMQLSGEGRVPVQQQQQQYQQQQQQQQEVDMLEPAPKRAAGALTAELPVWCLTAFEQAQLLGRVDNMVPWRDGLQDGPFLALGDLICTERYVLMQAHVVNRKFQRAALNLKPEFDFAHMTLAKLESGSSERRANSTMWVPFSASNASSIDMSAILRRMNEKLKRDGTLFRLIPAHVEQYFTGNRYNITGGEGRQIFRRLQDELLQECAGLSADCLHLWAQEPAHPHITYEYPEDGGDWDEEQADNGEEQGQAATPAVTSMADAPSSAASCPRHGSTASSASSSLQMVLSRLDKHKLGKLRALFVRERLSSSVLFSLSNEQLKEAGVSALGDRQRVRRLTSELPAPRTEGGTAPATLDVRAGPI